MKTINHKESTMSNFTRYVAIVVLTILVVPAFAADYNPEERGPHPVGVTTVTLTDASRTDPSTKDGPRTLMTEIWYPTTELGEEFPKNTFTDFLASGQNPGILMAVKMAFKLETGDIDSTYVNDAYRNAPVADGSFPLIVFSHGNGGFRMQSTFWCEHLASHGYIVVSPDHTGNAAATVVNGQMVVGSGTYREQSASDRPKDVSFLIDTMTSWNKGGDSRFAGKIDVDKIGVGGHSFGGYTSTLVADADERVDAIVPMAAVSPDRTTFNTPVLAIIATEDATIKERGNEVIRTYYDASKGPKYSIEFPDSGHFAFSDMHQFAPDFGDGVGTGTRITNGEAITFTPIPTVFQYTNGYSLAFLDKFVKGETDPAIDRYLNANNAPEGILIHKKGPSAGVETLVGQ